MTKVYTAKATTKEGRKGKVSVADSDLEFQFDKPSEMGGEGRGTNPEQLFAAAYTSCFGGAVKAVAQEKGVELEDYQVETSVSFNQSEDGKHFLSADIEAELPGVDEQQANEILEQAHQICPYSVLSREGAEVNVRLRQGQQAQR